MRAFFSYLPVLLFFFLLSGCKNQVEDLTPAPLTDYLSLQSGKFITYRLDSTVFTQTGRAQEIHSYQEKRVVDKAITDNLGRPSYRVYRFLRDTAGLTTWTSAGSFFITPTKGEVEVIEDNLRVVKLIFPITKAESWKGNRYLATEPYSSKYEFSYDGHIDLSDWDFSYSNNGETITLNGKPVNDVITIQGPDESVNVTMSDPKAFGYRSYSIDKYAKGIGLVYQELILWEYQPNPGGTPFRVGFGIKRSMIDHN